MSYQYNIHVHVKIWLSNNPNVFMNLENQIRLIEMRETNLEDIIHLVYESTLLQQQAIQELHLFCKENNIIAIDAHYIDSKLQTKQEKILYEFYKAEIYNLKTGGNLGVASDILRWLSPIYRYGTYTDFDFPIDTSHFPEPILVDAPILLNIGSLKMGKNEFILSNNDFVAIVDEGAAHKIIETVQQGIINKLTQYDTDFVERIEKELVDNSFLFKHLMKFMKNRSEFTYIVKSKTVNHTKTPISSLQARGFFYEMTMDRNKYLNFNQTSTQETHATIIKRLRKELNAQLTPTKYFFFKKEYTFIKHILDQKDDNFVDYLMKKEQDLYLKSIVVCTSGPIEISNALFEGYIVNTDNFTTKVQPFSFQQYGLQKSFQSKNSIPLHESVFGMLKFLGVAEGQLNDSSWLDSGKKLQAIRTIKLSNRQNELATQLPHSLLRIKNNIHLHLKKISTMPQTLRNQQRTETLEHILACFDPVQNVFNITPFKNLKLGLQCHNKETYDKKLIEELATLCHEAVIFSLAKNKKIKLETTPLPQQNTKTKDTEHYI